MSLHNLPIEKGRQSGILRKDRLCTLCNENEIGDEKHYFLKCSHEKFLSIRNMFKENLYRINSNLTLLPDDSLFIYLIALKDKEFTHLTGEYVFKILQLYKECYDEGRQEQ